MDKREQYDRIAKHLRIRDYIISCGDLEQVHQINVGCSVNPRYTNEDRVPKKLPQAEKKKRIVIGGADPAGCRTALTAKERYQRIKYREEGNICPQDKSMLQCRL